MNHMNPASHCACAHHKMQPLLIVLIGLTFLLGHLGFVDMNTANIIWPSLLIVMGLVKLKGGSCKCYMSA